MKHYTDQEIIEKTRETIHFFVKRQIDSFVDVLDENFVWIGDYEPLYMKGIPAFLQSVQYEIEQPCVELSDEEYSILEHTQQIWVTYGRFYAQLNNMSAKVHFTFVWKQQDENLVLIHANANHAKQMPTETAQSKIFENIPIAKSSSQTKEQVKLSLHDIHGNTHYIDVHEIVYIQSNNKLCDIHLRKSFFTVRKSLSYFTTYSLVRVHKSYVVNPLYVRSIRRYSATLTNRSELPLGKESYMKLKKILEERE